VPLEQCNQINADMAGRAPPLSGVTFLIREGHARPCYRNKAHGHRNRPRDYPAGTSCDAGISPPGYLLTINAG
jgi:hypothetical protein